MKQTASITQAFYDSCERAPEKICLIFATQKVSYAELAQVATRWAAGLRTWGLQPGARVALFLENSPTFLAAYLGIHMAGGVVVLVNTQYRQVELRHILNDAGVCLCITDPPRYPELQSVQEALPDLMAVITMTDWNVGTFKLWPDGTATPWEVSSFSPAPIQFPQADDLAIIAYTSGTTGRAKGAMLLHRNLAANSHAVTTAWRWTAADRLLLTLPLFHVHGLCVGIHGSWLTGSTVDLRRRFDPVDVYDTLLQGAVTMFFGVPTMYRRLISEARRRTSMDQLVISSEQLASGVLYPVRLFVSGSAPLDVQTFEEFEQLFGQPILERYGMTETLMNMTNPYEGERRPGTVGMPFPGQEARIVDVQTRQPVPDGTAGEIQIRGPNVCKGYWQRPDATAEAFTPDGWFSTGDLGWRSADGYYTIAGRVRELIISGGYNVYPREIEEVLLTHPGVAEAAVLGLPDPDLGEQVVAVIVPTPRASIDHPRLADELVALCRVQLAAYKKPRQVFLVDSLPRNAMGKVQKHLLKEQLRKA